MSDEDVQVALTNLANVVALVSASQTPVAVDTTEALSVAMRNVKLTVQSALRSAAAEVARADALVEKTESERPTDLLRELQHLCDATVDAAGSALSPVSGRTDREVE